MNNHGELKKAVGTLSMKIIRKDGAIEDIGEVKQTVFQQVKTWFNKFTTKIKNNYCSGD